MDDNYNALISDDHSIVVLDKLGEDSLSDFINANYINVSITLKALKYFDIYSRD